MSTSTQNQAVRIGIDKIELSTKSYDFIRALLREETGITLAENKRDMVYRRLIKRLRTLGLDSFEAYCEHLSGPDRDAEIRLMKNALTTNLTKFFRESHHFDHLAEAALPPLVQAAERSGGRRRLRIWSAGCSSGEEPHSIAITLCQKFRGLQSWDARILATDIDTDMVETGRNGVYQRRSIEGLSAAVQKRYFEPVDDENLCRVTQNARSLITFKPLNLLQPWPMKGPFDAIFCRNVVIYFDKPTQRSLFDRYADMLKDDGYLYIGHSESLFNVTDRFKSIGHSIYRKVS